MSFLHLYFFLSLKLLNIHIIYIFFYRIYNMQCYTAVAQMNDFCFYFFYRDFFRVVDHRDFRDRLCHLFLNFSDF